MALFYRYKSKMEIVTKQAEEYVADFTTKQSQLLDAIQKYTIENHAQPHMLSGHVQGRLLAWISGMIKPLRILEIGTFTGFSALCLAEGLASNGELHTIDIRKEDADVANSYFCQSQWSNQIVTHVGDAKQIIPTLKEKWDLVFIDADKISYIEYYELILPSVNKNGLIIADNVLFHGDVLSENIKGKNAIAIHAFNQHIKNDNRVEQLMLTVRDSLLFIRKI
jgi:caffeoyl-CoA O-methyltransferase